MDTDFPQVVLVKKAPEEQAASMDPQDPQHLHIKEDLWTSLEGEQLHLKEETNGEDDKEKHLFSQPHLQQIEDIDVPTSSSADQMKTEAGGGAETSRNPDLNLHEQTPDSSEPEVSGDEEEDDDVNLEPETGDGDWNESRSSESNVKTVNKSSSCPECGKQVAHQCSLKSFSCDDCRKSHMQVHTGQKPFVCENCDRSFTRKSHLNRHMRVHTGQKPFACENCGQSYRQKAHLKRHMRVHTGQKPFACKNCGQRFSRLTRLNRHMRDQPGCKELTA